MNRQQEFEFDMEIVNFNEKFARKIGEYRKGFCIKRNSISYNNNSLTNQVETNTQESYNYKNDLNSVRKKIISTVEQKISNKFNILSND
jgi:hypothetical protein